MLSEADDACQSEVQERMVYENEHDTVFASNDSKLSATARRNLLGRGVETIKTKICVPIYPRQDRVGGLK
jgi:hypothetical protein